jgi:serine/threonine-protein kinase RsbW
MCAAQSDPLVATIRGLEAGDAPSLVRCVLRCYGDSYPFRAFYDADEIRSLLSHGLLYSAVALDRQGEVVAHLGVVLEQRGDRTGDMVLGIVDSRFRGRQLILQTGARLAQELMHLDLIGLYQFATTAHAISQRLVLATSSIETGVLLGYLPETTSSMQRPDDPLGWRIPSIMLYLPLGEAPAREAYTPGRYREVVSDIYSRIGLERRLVEADAALPEARARLRLVLEPARSLARIEVERAGGDLVPEVGKLLREALSSDAQIVHLDLRLSDPCTPESAERVRGLGFFFGGILPELREGDVLRLQSVREEPRDRSEIEVFSEVGERLLDFVLEDRQAALGGSDSAARRASKPRGRA